MQAANVAELADALDLGSSGRKAMGVRPSPFAPNDTATSTLAQSDHSAIARRNADFDLAVAAVNRPIPPTIFG